MSEFVPTYYLPDEAVDDRDGFGYFVDETLLPIIKEGGNTVVDMLKHPSETVFDWGLMSTIPGIKGFALPFASDMAGSLDLLRQGDEQAGAFMEHMIKNPEDWYHLGRGLMLDRFENLKRNPEEYAE
jgi:hypothetical protein